MRKNRHLLIRVIPVVILLTMLCGIIGYAAQNQIYSQSNSLTSVVTPNETKTFNYTGSVQTLKVVKVSTVEKTYGSGDDEYTVTEKVPLKSDEIEEGYYEVELWGAQGGNYSSYQGGLGGHVKAVVNLEAGNTINIYVGGQNGYNGGGQGKNLTHAHTGSSTTGGGCYTVYSNGSYSLGCGKTEETIEQEGINGGGASDIRINSTNVNNRTLVAGGGAGASTTSNGNPGGTSTNLTTTASGQDSTDSTKGAGGGGYKGGLETYGGSNYISSDAISGYIKLQESGIQSGNGKITFKKVPTAYFHYDKAAQKVVEDNNGKEIVDEIPASYNSSENYYYINLPEDIKPALEDYQFLGFSTNLDWEPPYYKGYDAQIITGDVDLYAVFGEAQLEIELYDPNHFYVIQYIEAGVMHFESHTLTQKVGEYYNLPTPTYEGYTFSGWFKEKDYINQVTNSQICSADDDTTLYAKWTPNTYTVTFNANGGSLSGVSSKQVTYDATYGTLPTATKSGNYRFVGWYTQSSITSTANCITSDIKVKTARNHTLYAIYEEISGKEFYYKGSTQNYTITEDGYYKFDIYGASGGSYGQYSGGRGGYTTAVIYLTKGTNIQIEVGGQDGYNGGGSGAFSSGGGGTDIRINGTLALVAGGGGAANYASSGGSGGVTRDSGIHYQGENNSTDSVGTSTGNDSKIVHAGGGGGGYYGGTGGSYEYHTHTNKCFKTFTPEPVQYVNPHVKTNGVKSGFVKLSGTKYQCVVCAGKTSYTCKCDEGCGSSHGIVSSPKSIKDKDGMEDWDNSYNGSHHCSYQTCPYPDTGADVYIIDSTPSTGGSSYIENSSFKFYYTEMSSGYNSGNGWARITPLYELILDANKPTTQNADVNATNTPSIPTKSSLGSNSSYRTSNYRTPIVVNGHNSNTTYAFLVEEGKPISSAIEGLTGMPCAQLKGWTFQGWYTDPSYKTSTSTNSKEHCGKLITGSTIYHPADYGHSRLGNVVYAHYDEDEYYIKYVVNDTSNNIYNDTCTSTVAKGNTKLLNDNEVNWIDTEGKSTTTPTYTEKNTTEVYYTQKCLYDHDVVLLQNIFSKQGYYFDGWAASVDSTTGGRLTNTSKYYECETLKPISNGENFKRSSGYTEGTGYCNFNYKTDAKEIESNTQLPKWNYKKQYKTSDASNGTAYVLMYATWEPIRYKLQFNGTDNWNTEQKAYLQHVKGSDGKDTTEIRYDQVFTLDTNQFTRKAPHTIYVDSYGNTDSNSTKSEVTLKVGYEFSGWGFGYNTRKYRSTSNEEVTEYNKNTAWNLLELNTTPDWSQGLYQRAYINEQQNVRNVLSTDSIKAITQYLTDWQYYRTSKNIADKKEMKDKYFTQNLHVIWRRLSDNPDPDPDPEDPDDDNFNIKIKFDLNGGFIVDEKGDVITGTAVIKQELFNDYYYTFDIIGNKNTDLLLKSVTFDSYGKYSNSDNTKNFNSDTGLNVKFYKTDSYVNTYRFLGWSTTQGYIEPDTSVRIDNIIDNFNSYDSNHTKQLKIANDLTLYAIWEPVLNLDVLMYRTLGDSTDRVQNAQAHNWSTLGAGSISLKSGEEGTYSMIFNGETVGTVPVQGEYQYRKVSAEVTFDDYLTGIYNSTNTSIHDNLNQVSTDADKSESVLESSTLNRKWINLGNENSPITRKFNIPLYADTTQSSSADGSYSVTFTVKKHSFFWSFVKKLEESDNEVVKVKFNINSSNSSGGSGGSDPDPIIPIVPSDNTPSELKTVLR